uniref:uncharacterized protein LOC122601419 n=1 Tax=Erigeron canadensis TaxID=72917 RepID=UPI001CB9AE31|nr:uncharacterized protein LOC122601419 [Erigeron canadensis]
MEEVLGLTSNLSQHLQKKDEDILEGVSLVNYQRALKTLRAKGFGGFLKKISFFCQKHDIQMLKKTDFYVNSRNRTTKITNRHHFEVEIFNTVLDMQIIEFGDRFSKEYTELLANMASLSPCQLTFYYHTLQQDARFANLKGITDLARVLVDTKKKHGSFTLVYQLLKITLVLPVASVTVERCFSAMKLVKSDLRSRMSDNI